MTNNFDPYYKWLGIPPKDQPPHLYRLLGIEAFEDDREVIDAAANRLMSYLHEIAGGDEHPELSQSLLNEISRARQVLLRPDSKANYDEELASRLEAAASSSVMPLEDRGGGGGGPAVRVASRPEKVQAPAIDTSLQPATPRGRPHGTSVQFSGAAAATRQSTTGSNVTTLILIGGIACGVLVLGGLGLLGALAFTGVSNAVGPVVPGGGSGVTTPNPGVTTEVTNTQLDPGDSVVNAVPADPAPELKQTGPLREVLESSGLCRSRNPNLFWTMNDSGGKDELYLIRDDGRLVSTLRLHGADNFDWEDLAYFDHDGRRYVVVADTGDNSRKRGVGNDMPKLYIFEEPKLDLDKIDRKMDADAIAFTFEYADGAQDCEGLAITKSGVPLLVTKDRHGKGITALYQLPSLFAQLNRTKGDEMIHSAKRVTELRLPMISSMDISPDWTRLVLAAKESAYEWNIEFLSPNCINLQALIDVAPQVHSLPIRDKGESVAYRHGGRSWLLTSEGRDQPIWQVPSGN